MKEFKCNVAQKGFYAGPIFFIRSASHSIENKAFDVIMESEKLHAAEEALKTNILSKYVSEKNSEIRETVLFILEDETFTEKIENNIKKNSLNASAAVMKAADELAASLECVGSEYIRSRQDDIRGVASMLVSLIDGTSDAPNRCSAICATEISPAQLSYIDESLIGAMLTVKGSPNSHAAILAGNISIPYLYGSSEAVSEAEKADFIIIDSEAGTVITDPDEVTKASALKRMEQVTEQRRAEEDRRKDNTSIPECKTKVFANIEGPQDIEKLLQSGADGVGLFRTEYLFLGKDSIPTEEEQFEAYCAVLEAMGDKEVIIRTMDIGSDKKVRWLNIPNETNPALGLRGARVSLERKELFNTQLRALLRAGVKGNLKVMFPMIASAWEIDEIKDCVKKAADELEKEGIGYRIPPLGIMVETPAAAVCAEELAEKVDFFSIGTNDLTQYTLALDREALDLDRYFKPHHEAVFRLIGMTSEGGHKHGIETGVCGQLASDPEAVKRLIESGVDELSVAIHKVKATKALAAEAEKQIGAAKQKEKEEEAMSVYAVADGELIPMAEIPDPVFSAGIMGECFGILPFNGNVYSPVSGTVTNIAKTGHAMTIKDNNGAEVLIHVGINTVNLGQKAFKQHVSSGEHVEKGQLIMEANLKMIKDAGLSSVIIVAAVK